MPVPVPQRAAWSWAPLAALALSCAACRPPAPTVTVDELPTEPPAAHASLQDAPWRSTVSEAAGHEPDTSASAPVLLRGARILVGDGSSVARGHVLLKNGRIETIGSGDGTAPPGATIIDAGGKTITPGVIDTHSHMGVYPMPRVSSHLDGNELTAPLTAKVRAVDGFWPQDPAIQRAVAGGVTTIQVLPGSANLVGGRAVTLKLRPATSARAMHLRGAPDGVKMACGENPKRVHGTKNKRMPVTRMGNLAMQREAFLAARRLIDEWDHWLAEQARSAKKDAEALQRYQQQRDERAKRQAECDAGQHHRRRCTEWRKKWDDDRLEAPQASEPKLPPKRDLELETLAAVIEGKLLVHVHCYRADDMANMMALADEMGFRIRSFHHALEAYKIRDELAKRKISVSTWADWWGFKLEAYDGIPENLALVSLAGAPAIVHSDSNEGIRRLNQEAAKAMYAGRHRGLNVEPADAIRWLTQNPAWALGIDKRVGTLTKGKDADVVVWSGDPFSVYTRAEMVFIDGVLRHDVRKASPPWSDFEAGP